MYSFSAGAKPTITNYTDASAVVAPVSINSESTAHSDVLDGVGTRTPTAVTTNAAGTEFAPAPSGQVVPAVHYCTDFASRAMHSGGGMPENVPISPIISYTSDAYWFQYTYWYGLTKTSYSWAGAWHLSDYESGQGAYFLPYVSDALPGDLIWPNWTGTAWTGISHTGIVSLNSGGNIYIDQHTNNRYREPLYEVAGQQTWYGSDPNLHLWLADPYENN
jgi:hypothetical protein